MKEKQKQILSEIMQDDEKLGLYDDTIEQAAQEYSKYLDDFSYQDFQAGALWQQKQMYSEEEVIKKIIDYVDFQFNTNGELDNEIKKWFEQFSKLKNG